MRHATARIETPEAARVEAPAIAETDVDFARLVGADGWWRLAPEIRRRFTEQPQADRPIRFVGVMEQVRCSWLGFLLAQFCRLLGTPFAPFRGRDVPMTITLRHVDEHAVAWDREYRYPDRAPITVTSTKRVGDDGGLQECVGFGFGMRLAVFEANRALHFLSLRYFWRVGARVLQLPRLLTPGTAHIVHTDLGQGNFRFTMTIHHDLFGTLFEQDGVFHRVHGETQ